MSQTQIDIEKKLILIVQQLLVDSNAEYTQRKVTLDLSLQRHLGIDSFGRAELFQRIEKTFEIKNL
jgi:fatty-acyl-CoA synthase